ncbi:cysteine hydrolase family protein [Gottfriedia luciferensis]|uniref:cysteine hydrolase family protein n=1 Tax=Gottfriedia luciferensis TaxID=178774 RepID=UPI000B443E44|nr:cysteine hydrolase family protein [Gottfriedia luciferensis]
MKKSALCIIDVQVLMFSESDPVYNGEKLLYNLNQLITKARTNHLPVFYIQHSEEGSPLEYGSPGWEIQPDIAPIEGDIIIHKLTPDSFFKTNLSEELTKREISHLVMAGIQTEICVDTTIRSAFGKGYEVTLVTDAHSTWNSNVLTAEQIINHHNQTLRWFADPKTTDEVEF